MPAVAIRLGPECRHAITAANALVLPLLLGCIGDPNGVPNDFFFEVDGLVLEYTDATKTTTRPVPDVTWVGVILPDGQTRDWCDFVDCYTTNFVADAYTFTDVLTHTAGHYSLQVRDPAHRELRVRAWEEARQATTTDPLTGRKVYTYSGKTATAPRLAEPPDCKHGRIEEDGPTLIIE